MGNLAKRYIGKTDEPLCKIGIERAKSSGIFPEVKTVFSSPLSRAQKTAQIKFPNSRIEIIPDFREMDFGIFDGYSSDEMIDWKEYTAWVDGMCEAPCPGGEDIFSFSARVTKAFTALISDCAARGDEAVYIVAHGGSISAIMEEFAIPKRKYFDWFLENCCAFVTSCDISAHGGSIVLTDCRRTDGAIE